MPSELLAISNFPLKLIPLCEAIGLYSIADFKEIPLDILYDELIQAKKFLRLDIEIPSKKEISLLQKNNTTILNTTEKKLETISQHEKNQKDTPLHTLPLKKEIPEAIWLDEHSASQVTLPLPEVTLYSLPETPQTITPILDDEQNSTTITLKSYQQEHTEEGKENDISYTNQTLYKSKQFITEGEYPDITPFQTERSASFVPYNAEKDTSFSHYLHKRGITHLTSARTFLGALSVLFLTLAFWDILAVAIAFMTMGESFPQWAPYTLLALPIGIISYGIFSLRSRCSVCRMPLFYSKNCAKNNKAHNFRPLGFVISTALHIILFRWFRCPYCGSAQQLFDAHSSSSRWKRKNS